MNRRRRSTTWLRLRWPREVSTEQVLAALLALHGLSNPRRGELLRLRAVGHDRRVDHYLGVPVSRVDTALRQIGAAIPGITATIDEAYLPGEVTEAWRSWFSTRLRPLKLDDPGPTATAVVTALATASRTETLVYEWVLGPVRRPISVGSTHRSSPIDGSLVKLAAAPFLGAEDLDSEGRTALRSKQGLPGWRAALYLGVRAGTSKRRHQLLGGLAAAVRTAQAPGAQVGFRTSRTAVVSGRTPWFWPLSINCGELRALSGWPIGCTAEQPVDAVLSRQLPPGGEVSQRGRVIGTSTVQPTRQLALNAADSLLHLHVLGPTGVGKSTLLLNLILQDASAGRGIVLVEPKGDLVRAVLERLPDDRLDDVVVIDPMDHAPVGLNPLGGSGGSAQVVDGVLAVFKGLFSDSWGPRTQDLLTAGLLTLQHLPQSTLVGLPLLFTDSQYRGRALRLVRDPLALDPFWSWYEDLSAAERASVLAPLMNKLRAFLLRPAVRRIIGQADPRFDMRQLFTERRIVLVNLAKGSLGGESAGLLGSLFVARLWQTTLARQAIARERRHPVMAYVDEFQDYLHLPTDLSDVLAQARGLGVGLTLAHQHLAQLTPPVRAGVLANARSRVLFQLGDDDARSFARTDSRLEADDFRNLPAFEIYASLAAHGQQTRFASGRTFPEPELLRNAEEAMARSRERWGTPRADIDAALNEMTQPSPNRTPAASPGAPFGIRRAGDDDLEEET